MRSLSQRLWSMGLSILGVAILANLAWALLKPLLPVLVGVGLVVVLVSSWNRWRWR
jgi:hypothetical protein